MTLHLIRPHPDPPPLFAGEGTRTAMSLVPSLACGGGQGGGVWWMLQTRHFCSLRMQGASYGHQTFQVLGTRLKQGCAETSIAGGIRDLIQGTLK